MGRKEALGPKRGKNPGQGGVGVGLVQETLEEERERDREKPKETRQKRRKTEKEEDSERARQKTQREDGERQRVPEQRTGEARAEESWQGLSGLGDRMGLGLSVRVGPSEPEDRVVLCFQGQCCAPSLGQGPSSAPQRCAPTLSVGSKGSSASCFPRLKSREGEEGGETAA